MADASKPGVVRVEVEFDPAQLSKDRIKEITDYVVAEIARIATGTRGGGSHSKSEHSNAHLKW